MEDYNAREYYIIYGVDPKDYSDVNIFVLNFSHILLRKLEECGFKTIYSLLFAKRSDISSVRGFGIRQVELFETELKAFIEKKNGYALDEKATSDEEEHSLEKKYSLIYGVNSDDYSNIDISVLSLTPGIQMRLVQNGFNTIASLLEAKRSKIQSVKGIGTKQLDKIELELKNYTSSSSEHNAIIDTFSKSQAEAIILNRKKILMGDFSFKKDINNDLLPIIEKYETSYEALGSEIVSDIAENPSIYTKLTSILDTLSRKYLLYSNSVKKAYQSLALLPASIASKPALSFIMATLSKDDADDLLKLGDMATIKLSSLPYYLTFGMRKEADLIAQVYTKCVFNMSESIEKLLKGLHKNEMQKITLEMRSKGYTLEQIGQQYGKSRERIRQIEARARRYFDHWNAHSKIMYFLSALLDSKEVILEDELIPFLGEHSEEVLYLLKSSDISIYSYIADANCFILCPKSKIDEAITMVQKLPDLFSDDTIDSLVNSSFPLNTIRNEILMIALKLTYKKTGKIYYRTSLNSSKIYLYIIQKYYPDGIMLYDDTVMIEFRNRIIEEFGDVSISPNDRAVRARIMDNCIICGKGKYMLKKESYMPEELLSEIISYIDNEERSVLMLNTVFSVFESHLLLNGIDNRYFLQGILKEKLSDKYSFSRDYIFKDGNIGSFHQEVVNYIKEFNHPITKKQIYDHFPGITEIILNFSVSDDNIINFFGEYLHGSRLNLNDDDVKYLYNVVSNVVKDGEVHHGKELYETINRNNPGMLTKAGIFQAYSLFSVTEYLFRNEFQFSRPYLALNDVELSKPLEVIGELVKSKDIISVKSITECAKEFRYQIYSILELMNSFNDSHLLINSEFIATFDYIGINKDIAEKVETIIINNISDTTLIADLSCINTLPKLNVPWTDWLIYSTLLKWSHNLDVSVTNKYFYYASPVVAFKGKMDLSGITAENSIKMDNSKIEVDDLDNIDDLIADFLDDDLFEDLL